MAVKPLDSRLFRRVGPVPSERHAYGAADRVLLDRYAVEHTGLAPTQLDYFQLDEHAPGSRDPLYNEPLERVYRGPYRLDGHIEAPNATPEVREEGFRATWQINLWIARATWEKDGAGAEGASASPSEGDVVGFWNDCVFFTDNEAQQGDTVPRMCFYFSVQNVTAVGTVMGSPAFVGFSLALMRNTNFAPERRVEKRVG